MENKSLLEEGLSQLHIDYQKETINLLEELFDFYSYWNKKINLSAIETKEDFFIKHILDSAAGLRFFSENKEIGDLGSGGGFPGVVLKVLSPRLKIHLIEVIQKKVDYLQELNRQFQLGLFIHNPTHQKIQQKMDIITCRAFGNMEKIIKESKKYLTNKGKIIAFKGKKETFLAEIKKEWQNKITIHPINVPFLDAERNIVIYQG